MRLTYDPRHNIAYLRFHEKTGTVDTIHVSDELNVDLAPDGTVYGIELLNANEQLSGEDQGKLDPRPGARIPRQTLAGCGSGFGLREAAYRRSDGRLHRGGPGHPHPETAGTHHDPQTQGPARTETRNAPRHLQDHYASDGHTISYSSSSLTRQNLDHKHSTSRHCG